MAGRVVFIVILSSIVILYAIYFFIDIVKWNKYFYTINGKTTTPNILLSIVSFPSIWMIGLLNLNTPMSRCDYYKTSLSRQMFWNEHLFQQLLWIIDDHPECIRIVETNYRFEWPFPNFLIATASPLIMKSMEKIHAHTRMRSPQYELQQWMTFYLDEYADKYAQMHGLQSPDVLAIADADAQLQSLVTIESIFPELNHSNVLSKQKLNIKLVESDFKLKAHGLDMPQYSEATGLFLNRSQVGYFMITFPVYVYRTTLVNLRHYVSTLHNKTFDAAFEAIMTTSRSYYSQFVIILTYAYWFERDRYSFHIQAYLKNIIDESITPNDVQRGFVLKPPVRVMLHTKNALLQQIQKGCCFSYQLNQTENIDDAEFTNNTKHKISSICNSFGSVESHFEMVCEDPYTSDIARRSIWKRNDTITEHYERVKEALKNLSRESVRKKKNVCSKFLAASNPQTWFPRAALCRYP